MLNMRDNRGGSRAVFTTEDGGETWAPHESSRSALIEPVCTMYSASMGVLRSSEAPCWHVTICTLCTRAESWCVLSTWRMGTEARTFMRPAFIESAVCLTMVR